MSYNVEATLDADQFERAAALFLAHAGVELHGGKLLTVQSRLRPRLRALSFRDFDAYLDYLENPDGVAERIEFYNALTTNTTSFFREPHHYEHMCEQIREGMADRSDDILVWSAGCSRGQEPISIALSLLQMSGGISPPSARILATDLNTEALNRARRGRYPIDQMDLIDEAHHRHIRRKGEEMEFDDRVRQMISYRHLNIFEDWPIKVQFDFIYCRNVMIYFQPEIRQTLIERFVNQLKPGGFFYIGHSESALARNPRLEPAGVTTFRRVA